jgi:hypothetical protein
MMRWYVGVKQDGRREVFADSTGTDPTAALHGYTEICGPYKSQQEAATAAKGKPTPPREPPRSRPKR